MCIAISLVFSYGNTLNTVKLPMSNEWRRVQYNRINEASVVGVSKFNVIFIAENITDQRWMSICGLCRCIKGNSQGAILDAKSRLMVKSWMSDINTKIRNTPASSVFSNRENCIWNCSRNCLCELAFRDSLDCKLQISGQ